jgi:type I restriction enzyme, S subunit
MAWERVRLGRFLNNRDIRYKPDDERISGLKRIEKIDFEGNIYLSDKPSNTDMILVKKGDLVISGINVEKGAISVYNGEEDVIATIHYSSYEYNPEDVDIEFLKYLVKSKEFVEAIKKQVPGGIKTEIKPKHLLPLELTIPTTLFEQKAIVKELNGRNINITEIATGLTHQLSLVRQLRQAFLREALQGKLVPQNTEDEPAAMFLKKIKAEKEKLVAEKKLKKEKPLPPIKPEEIPFQIPESWVWCRLGEIIFSTEGGKSPNCLHRPANSNEWGVIKTTAVQELRFIEDENKVLPNQFIINEHYKVKKGDVLITRAGPKNRVGIVCCVPKLTSNLILSDKTIRINHSKNLLASEFIAIALNSPGIKPFIEQKMVGMADSQVNISQASMRIFIIPLPPLSEQQRIVAKLEELMGYCDRLEKEIKAAKARNEELMEVVLREVIQQ